MELARWLERNMEGRGLSARALATVVEMYEMIRELPEEQQPEAWEFVRQQIRVYKAVQERREGRGMSRTWTVAGVHVDQLLSGSTDDRPAFQAAIARALQDDDVVGILVWRFSRFARDDVDSMLYKAQLAKAGVKVVSYQEPIPDADGWGALIERFIEIMDSRQLAKLREDIVRGQRHLARQGYATGGAPPVGYLAVQQQRGTRADGQPRYNTVWIPDPTRAPDILAAFQMLAAGHSYKEINDRYHLYKRKCNLHGMFRNLAYTGRRVYGKRRRASRTQQPRPEEDWTILENAHEAIVPPDLWDRAQAILDARRAPAERARSGPRGQYLLSGLAVCARCNSPVNGTSHLKYGHRRYYYYRCSRRTQLDNCDLPYVTMGHLDDAVLDKIREHVLTPQYIQDLVDWLNARLAGVTTDLDGQRAGLERQIQTLDQRITRLVSAIEDHGVQSAAVATRLAELESARAQARQNLAQLDAAVHRVQPVSISPAEVAGLVQDLRRILDQAPMPERRALLRSFIERIEVGHKQAKIIYWPVLPSPPSGGDFLPPELCARTNESIVSGFRRVLEVTW